MNQKRHTPRLANAIKKALAYANEHSGWWYAYPSDNLGRLIIEYAYGADRYDVLNSLCPGIHGKVVTYARGDIRHRRKHCRIDGMTIKMIVLLLVVVFVQSILD